MPRCLRCHGLLVRHFVAPSLHMARCVNCGDLIDRVVLHNRTIGHVRECPHTIFFADQLFADTSVR
jgi:hypothetical protein